VDFYHRLSTLQGGPKVLLSSVVTSLRKGSILRRGACLDALPCSGQADLRLVVRSSGRICEVIRGSLTDDFPVREGPSGNPRGGYFRR
jgi:hypothetical protein